MQGRSELNGDGLPLVPKHRAQAAALAASSVTRPTSMSTAQVREKKVDAKLTVNLGGGGGGGVVWCGVGTGGWGGGGGGGGADQVYDVCVSPYTPTMHAPNWVAEHLGASSRRPPPPLPRSDGGGQTWAVYLCTRP